MEGPGGYQFVGRTVQVWNAWRTTTEFTPGKPWLLQPFDRIKFYPVSAEELLRLREDFPRGKFSLRIEEGSFSLAAHNKFLGEHAGEIATFTARRQQAFAEERARWQQGTDAAGVGCYLESSKEANVPFYERLGFRVTDTYDVDDGRGPRLWLMWRDPVPPPSG